MLYYQVLYNLLTTCFGHLTWPSSGLYLAYRGLYYINIVIYKTMTMTMQPRQQTTTPPSHLPIQ